MIENIDRRKRNDGLLVVRLFTETKAQDFTCMMKASPTSDLIPCKLKQMGVEPEGDIYGDNQW